MKNKKLLAIALATAFVFGGNNNSIDINVPTAYAVPERFEDDLSIPEYDEAQKEEQEVRDAYNRKKNERISKETEYKKVKNRKPSFNDDMGKYLEKLKETKSAYLKAKGEEIALEKKLKEMQARSEAILQKYETTRYVDESGKDIISPESGEQGPKEIEGYKFLETKWNKYAFNIHVYTFDLDGYKNEIIAKINGLDSLSDEEKSELIQKLESLNNKDELDNVYKEAESANEKAKALENYKKKYSEKIDGLSDLTEKEKQAAKEEIANATSEAEVIKAYNKAFSANQDAKYEREKKEREEKFAKAKEDAKKAIDDYGDKLTEKEKEAFKEQIDKARTKGAIAGILEEAKKASEKEPKPEEPAIDQDYKDMFLENILSLSKLTDEEKEAFKERIEKAKSNGEIYDIYNEAVALNNSRDKKPEKPVDPEEPTDPSTPTEPEEPSKPENPSQDNDDYLIIPPVITNPSTTEVVKDDIIYVPKGYAHIKEGFYKKSDLIDLHNRLRKAVKENRIQVKAAEFLLEYTPKTVASVKDKLINLIEKSNKLVKKGKDVLEEYDKILDLDDKCQAL